jgi:hypothetical protein
MADANELYAELKPDVELLAQALFELSERFLRDQGNFLPHAAVLTDGGEVKLVAAAPPSEVTNSTEVLPLLHDGLRHQAKDTALRAIGVSENVTVTLQGQQPTKAIKVLFEHKRGLTVALYLPFAKKLLRGFVMGQPFTLAAKPEVNAWDQSAA